MQQTCVLFLSRAWWAWYPIHRSAHRGHFFWFIGLCSSVESYGSQNQFKLSENLLVHFGVLVLNKLTKESATVNSVILFFFFLVTTNSMTYILKKESREHIIVAAHLTELMRKSKSKREITASDVRKRQEHDSFWLKISLYAYVSSCQLSQIQQASPSSISVTLSCAAGLDCSTSDTDAAVLFMHFMFFAFYFLCLFFQLAIFKYCSGKRVSSVWLHWYRWRGYATHIHNIRTFALWVRTKAYKPDKNCSIYTHFA